MSEQAFRRERLVKGTLTSNLVWHRQQNMSRLMKQTTKWHVHQAKTQINLGICPVWSESSLSAWRKLGSLATHWVHSEDSDQSRRMPRLIWVFAGRTVILLVLSWGGSYANEYCLITGNPTIGPRRTLIATSVRHSATCCDEKWLMIYIVLTLNILSLWIYWVVNR